ncbi:FAD-binding oxidoreductase [Kitasatospora sp. NPDC092039]|uniref:FAD-binding oxidoreductase n=1 Tax=Kitasatospora sp. NPDC092039 TaxID=3364086 RepID=UPI0038045D95
MSDRTVDPTGPTVVRPGDPRYENLVQGYNHRFVGRPDQVHVVTGTEEVVAAVDEAVAAGRRIAVRSGGHCFEDFTASPDIQVLLDVSQLNGVSYDPARRAIEVGSGALLGDVYRTLFKRWGVTIPAGTCLEVGVGGHFPAGGYGHLSRRDGLVVDHLYAVEVVVVDESGRARAVVATADPEDPHHDLWWAHTGGGGGNFGVVTRYWLRTPGADAADPALLLPRAPARVWKRTVMWPWARMTERSLTTLLRNYCTWYEDHDDADAPAAGLWSNLIVTHRDSGAFGMVVVIDHDGPDAEKVLAEHFDSVSAGVGVEPSVHLTEVVPWLSSWLPSYSFPNDPKGRYKDKAAYLRKGFTDRQLGVIWRYLTDPEHINPMSCLVVAGFGGKVNTVAPGATAAVQRDSVLKVLYGGGVWQSADQDEACVSWIREFYREVHAGTGGVPVSDAFTDGTYIGYPDSDLADPAWNTSGVPWSTLYYGANYPRLQRVKRAYDPRNVFRHALSIEPTDAHPDLLEDQDA